MPIDKKIEDLVYLLGAESEAVRGAVVRELQQGEYDLEKFLKKSGEQLPPETLFQIHELLRNNRDEHIRGEWLDWLAIEDEYQQLEAAFSFLATAHGPAESTRPLATLLDDIVGDFLEHEINPNTLTLNRYLFEEKRFSGNTGDYYHPANSNLCLVITSGKGLPISLACLFMLCGSRLDLDITGFNMRGHFLAKSVISGKPQLFDCFNNGRVYCDDEMALLARSDVEGFQHLMDHPAQPPEIISRVLYNMTHAYFRTGDLESYHLVQDLLSDLQTRLENGGRLKTEQPDTRDPNCFSPGQLVRHKRYSYRGVVVASDTSCRADEHWYRANRTQPDRKQPWYHVLVDRSNLTTYAAHSSLEEDSQKAEIHHPLVPLFFDDFHGNRYERNDVPWILPG